MYKSKTKSSEHTQAARTREQAIRLCQKFKIAKVQKAHDLKKSFTPGVDFFLKQVLLKF